MQEIKISKQNADAAFKAATPEVQKVLSILFGKPVEKKPLKDLTTFESICEAVGVDVLDYTHNPENDNSIQSHIDIQTERCKLINKVVNDGWKAKMYDTTQRKWRVWANLIPDLDNKYNPAGFRLSFFVCYYDDSTAFLGVRPFEYFKDEETAKHIAKYFLPEFEKLMQYEFQQ